MPKTNPHIEALWRALEERVDASPPGADVVRAWWNEDLAGLPREFADHYEKLNEHAVWSAMLRRDAADLPTTRRAWDDLATAVSKPLGATDWFNFYATAADLVSSVSTFVDPQDFCDEDEEDLEVWWSHADELPFYVCNFNHEFEWQRRILLRNPPDLVPWRGSEGVCLPADRSVIEHLYMEVELLDVPR